MCAEGALGVRGAERRRRSRVFEIRRAPKARNMVARGCGRAALALAPGSV